MGGEGNSALDIGEGVSRRVESYAGGLVLAV